MGFDTHPKELSVGVVFLCGCSEGLAGNGFKELSIGVVSCLGIKPRSNHLVT